MVTVGYFTSEPGATVALKYEPVPGAYHGCVPLAEIGRAWATR
jgi:gluconate 2-dehydrogenase gamma chain